MNNVTDIFPAIRMTVPVVALCAIWCSVYSAEPALSKTITDPLPRHDRAVLIGDIRQREVSFNSGFFAISNGRVYLVCTKQSVLAQTGQVRVGLALGENRATWIDLKELVSHGEVMKWRHHPTEEFSVLGLPYESPPAVLEQIQRVSIPLSSFATQSPIRGTVVESVGIGKMLLPINIRGSEIHLLTLRSYVASQELTPPRFWGKNAIFAISPETPLGFAGSPVFMQKEDPQSIEFVGMNLGGLTDGGTTKIDAVIPAHVIKDFLASLEKEE